MGTFFLAPLLLALTSGSPPTRTVDLTKIPRSLVKQPAYQTTDPGFCLLVLGPKAETRIWLIVDGKTLYVDRNGNGDLTESGKKVTSSGATFAIGEIKKVGDRSKHLQLCTRGCGDRQRPTCFGASSTPP